MAGIKDFISKCEENVPLSLARGKLNLSFLMSQVRPCMLPCISQIAEKASSFRILVRVGFCDG